jgi:hypothetical protein
VVAAGTTNCDFLMGFVGKIPIRGNPVPGHVSYRLKVKGKLDLPFFTCVEFIANHGIIGDETETSVGIIEVQRFDSR